MRFHIKMRGISRLAKSLTATVIVGALSLVLANCSVTKPLGGFKLNTATKDARDALLTALSGTWDNSTQFANVPATLKITPSVAGDWLDLQHAQFQPITAPAIGDKVLYLEWRNQSIEGGAGTISRQRIWSFKTDANNIVRMDFYAFIDGKLWSANSNFNDLTPATLRGYGEACALYFSQTDTTFIGEITAKDCSITAASGRRMGINARVEMRADGVLEYKESGVLDDGRFAFRVPPTQPYRFIKVVK